MHVVFVTKFQTTLLHSGGQLVHMQCITYYFQQELGGHPIINNISASSSTLISVLQATGRSHIKKHWFSSDFATTLSLCQIYEHISGFQGCPDFRIFDKWSWISCTSPGMLPGLNDKVLGNVLKKPQSPVVAGSCSD